MKHEDIKYAVCNGPVTFSFAGTRRARSDNGHQCSA